MPISPPKPCRQPGCGVLVSSGYCESHSKARPKRDRSRHKLADTRRWRKMRAEYLRINPLCKDCGALAAHVHHIVKHEGDERRFFDWENNWMPLCGPCHSKRTARGE